MVILDKIRLRERTHAEVAGLKHLHFRTFSFSGMFLKSL